MGNKPSYFLDGKEVSWETFKNVVEITDKNSFISGKDGKKLTKDQYLKQAKKRSYQKIRYDATRMFTHETCSNKVSPYTQTSTYTNKRQTYFSFH